MTATTYEHLGAPHFFQSAAMAAMLHLLAAAFWYVLPHEQTMIIPVRALHLKIAAAEGRLSVENPAAKPSVVAAAHPKPVMHKDAPVKPKPAPVPIPRVVEQTPQTYVRDTSEMATEETGDASARYEQLISSRIQQFKHYPPAARATGAQGEGVVRLRITRRGKIIYSSLERSTGSEALDAAIMEMVEAANPLPPVPEEYPGGYLVEFLIPVSFMLE